MRKTLFYGLQPELQLNVGLGNVNSVFPINEHQFIASTDKEIVKFENNSTLSTASVPLNCSTFIPQRDIIIGITFQSNEFIIFSSNNLKEPIFKGIRTNQAAVTHIIYSKKSESILTIGKGVKIWKILFQKGNNVPESITLVSEIMSDYEQSILNPPSFDFTNESIHFSSKNGGISAFNLKGEEKRILSKSQVPKSTVFAYFQPTKKIIITENQDVCVWNHMQIMTRRYTLPSESIISCFICDNENILLISSQFNFFLMNLKTGKSWRCFSMQHPITRVFYFDGKVCVTSGSTVYLYKIVIPWRIWSQGINETQIIMRVPKKSEASRIFILSNGSFMRFFSPKNGAQLTTASASLSVPVSNVFYDREGQRDILFLVLKNGNICGFNATFSPCKEDIHVSMGALAMCSSTINGKKEYIFATKSGKIIFCDYLTLSVRSTLSISHGEPCNYLFADDKQLIVLTDDEIVCVDAEKEAILAKENVPRIDGVVKYHNGIVYVGEKTGKIRLYDTRNREIKEVDTNCSCSSQITSICFGSCFWVTTSFDGDVNYWNYAKNECFAEIHCNLPLFGSEVLNGYRDLLVVVENEVMIIPGTLIFGKEKDPEDPSTDNYDRRNDYLSSEAVMRFASEELQIINNDDDTSEDSIETNTKEKETFFKELKNPKEKTKNEDFLFDSQHRNEENKPKEHKNEEKNVLLENTQEEKKDDIDEQHKKEEIKQKEQEEPQTEKEVKKVKPPTSPKPSDDARKKPSPKRNVEVEEIKKPRPPQEPKDSAKHRPKQEPKNDASSELQDSSENSAFSSMKYLFGVREKIPLSVKTPATKSMQSFFDKGSFPFLFKTPSSPNATLAANNSLYKKKPYVFKPDLSQKRLSLDSLDIIDPMSQPILYRKTFFKKDNGYSMSSSTYKTLLQPPTEFDESSNSQKEEVDDNAPHFVRPARPKTPPLVRRNSAVYDALTAYGERRKTQTPTKKPAAFLISRPAITANDVKQLYGRGNHVLIPLSNETNRSRLKQDPAYPFLRYKTDNYHQQTRGTIGESLVIQPIHIQQPEQQGIASNISRGRIIVPQKKQPKK